MPGFHTLTAVAAPIVADNVDTDQIFPSRFTSKNRADGMFGTYFLHDQRFDEAPHVFRQQLVRVQDEAVGAFFDSDGEAGGCA